MDAIRAQIVEGIDLMIHMARFRDGSRRVVEVQELLDFENRKYRLNPLFRQFGYGLVFTGNALVNRSKLALKGYEDDGRLQ